MASELLDESTLSFELSGEDSDMHISPTVEDGDATHVDGGGDPAPGADTDAASVCPPCTQPNVKSCVTGLGGSARVGVESHCACAHVAHQSSLRVTVSIIGHHAPIAHLHPRFITSRCHMLPRAPGRGPGPDQVTSHD
jgi:hypothetical protein